MIKLRAAISFLTALGASAVASATFAALPAAATSDWNQYGHDASRASATDARGPRWPRLAPGWPVPCPDCWAVPSVAPVRLAGESKPMTAIVVPAGDRTLYAFSRDGQPLPGYWPAVLGPASAWNDMMGTPAIATDRSETRIFSQSLGWDDYWGAMHAATGDGKPAPGPWPWIAPGMQMFSFTTLARDTSGPAKQTLFFDYGDGRGGGFLNAMGLDGSPRAGWPVRVGFAPIFGGPAVAPDGSVYIAAGRRDGDMGNWYWVLEGLTPDGKRKPGWPQRPQVWINANMFYQGPAVGRDGTVYLGVLLDVTGGWTGRSAYYAFAPSGELREGWPVEMDGGRFIMYTPAVAADGTSYISVTRVLGPGAPPEGPYQASVEAYDKEGQLKPGWPITWPEHADWDEVSGIVLDRDGNVFFGHDDTLYGLTPTGRPLPGWPLKIEGVGYAYPYPAIARDGTIYVLGITDAGVVSLVAVEQGTRPVDPQARGRRLTHGTTRTLPEKVARRLRRGRRLSGDAQPAPTTRMLPPLGALGSSQLPQPGGAWHWPPPQEAPQHR